MDDGVENLIESLFGEIKAVGESVGGPDDGRLTYFTEWVPVGHILYVGSDRYQYLGNLTSEGRLVFEYGNKEVD